MVSKLQSQELFNVLSKSLENAFFQSLRNQYYIDLQQPQLIKTPLDVFLNEVEQGVPGLNCDKNFLKDIYSRAFMVLPIPKKINHIAFTGKISGLRDDVENNTEITLWIDLDKLSAHVNTYLQMDSIPHAISNQAHQGESSQSRGANYTNLSRRVIVNQQHNPDTPFILSLLTGLVSGYSLLIAALAVANVGSLSVVSISAVVVIGIIAGAASYYFFQNRNGGYTNPGATLSPESESTLDELFDRTFQVHHQKNPATRTDKNTLAISDELKAADIFSEALPLLGLN